MHEFLYLAKALSEHMRLRVVCALQAHRELCVCQLVEMLGLSQSTVSKHMSILHQARVVESRKEGLWVYYALPGADAPDRVRAALQWVHDSLVGDGEVCRDLERLTEIMRVPLEGLCRKGKS